MIAVKPEVPAAVPVNGQKSTTPTYDPGAIYLLEFCTTLALRDDETVKELGGDVVEALQNVVRDATSYHPIMISRSIFYLLNLLHASYVSISVRSSINETDKSRTTLSFGYRLYYISYRASKRMCLIKLPY